MEETSFSKQGGFILNMLPRTDNTGNHDNHAASEIVEELPWTQVRVTNLIVPLT